MLRRTLFAWALCCATPLLAAPPAEPPAKDVVRAAMKRAAVAFRAKASSHGGYVYYYTPDFSRRWGEGEATADQIFVQRPGSPTVGLAFLAAYQATDDRFYLDAARDVGEALVYGQLSSGGWTQTVDFDPAGERIARYRNGPATGKRRLPDHSTLDDGVTPHALHFLMDLDRALLFKVERIYEACDFARKALLAAQFRDGAFPQVWSGPTPSDVVLPRASFPDYDWKTENRVKAYWSMPTLNDDLCGHVAAALEEAWEVYGDDACRRALVRLGDFLILAQLPEPQPAWAQQYDLKMRPMWARKFEPPAVCGRESQDAMEVLLKVYAITGDPKYLAPLPAAIRYLEASRLPDGRLARYYELRTNKPLYMTREYVLTYDDGAPPEHYSWKTESRLEAIRASLAAAQKPRAPRLAPRDPPPPVAAVAVALAELDADGLWISVYSADQRLTGQPKFRPGERFVSSEVFSRRLETLAGWIRDSRTP